MFVLIFGGSTIKVDRDSEIDISDGKVRVQYLREWRTDKAGASSVMDKGTVSHEPAVTPIEEHSSQEEKEIENVGAHFEAAIASTRRKGGRPKNPNSGQQRVWTAIRSILDKKGPMSKWDVLNAVYASCGDVKRTTVDVYANSAPSVRRNYGEWSLISE